MLSQKQSEEISEKKKHNRFFNFLPEQGRHSTKTTMLFVLLAIAITTIMVMVYASYAVDQNGFDVNSLACEIACYMDKDCDDSNNATLNICNNDGTCDSYCTNLEIEPPCDIACNNDKDCNDENPETIDVCNNDVTCEASCTNIAIQLTIPTETTNASSPDEAPVEIPPAKKEITLPKAVLKAVDGKGMAYGIKFFDASGVLAKETREIPDTSETPAETITTGIYNVELELTDVHVKKILLKNATIEEGKDLLELNSLQDSTTEKGIRVKNPFLFNPVTNFETGTINLVPPTETNAVLKCKNWDSTANICNEEWQTITTFDNTGQEISIQISAEDPVFGFAEITIINVQSHPSVGGNWEVMFETVGKADLTIKAIDETTWSNENENEDLLFKEIKCGSTTLSYEWVNDSVIVRDYECDEEGTEISKVLTAGKHDLEFDFGGQKAYAHNQTDVNVYNYSCIANDAAANTEVWTDACDGGAGSENERLNYNDGITEVHTSNRKFAGVKTAIDWAVGDCASINSVTLYYLWWADVEADHTAYIQLSNNGDDWWEAVGSPNPTSDNGLLKKDVSVGISGIDWNCSNFDGTQQTGSTAIIKSNLKDSTNALYTYTWDTLHFVVTYTAGSATCACPPSGHWEINDGSACTLTEVCNAPADVHISYGSLNITQTGSLVIASGYKLIIDKASDGLSIENEGERSLVLETT